MYGCACEVSVLWDLAGGGVLFEDRGVGVEGKWCLTFVRAAPAGFPYRCTVCRQVPDCQGFVVGKGGAFIEEVVGRVSCFIRGWVVAEGASCVMCFCFVCCLTGFRGER